MTKLKQTHPVCEKNQWCEYRAFSQYQKNYICRYEFEENPISQLLPCEKKEKRERLRTEQINQPEMEVTQ